MKNLMIFLSLVPLLLGGNAAFADEVQYIFIEPGHVLQVSQSQTDKSCEELSLRISDSKKTRRLSALGAISAIVGAAMFVPLAGYAYSESNRLPRGSHPNLQGHANMTGGVAASVAMILAGGTLGLKVGEAANKWIWGVSQ